MTAGALAVGILLAVWPSVHAAQVAPNRATEYLHPTDSYDARALWVNPAGLGMTREASVYAELAVANPGSRGKLRQINAGFNARGLSFGYQRDVFDAGARGHTYRLGLAGSAEGFAAGGAVAYYRGEAARATGWDVGMTYQWRPALTVGVAIANIGEPDVRGVELPTTFLPGFTWRPLAAAALSAHARLTSDSVLAYAFGARWGLGLGARRLPLQIVARLDTDSRLRRGAFAFGLSVGGADRAGVTASTPGDVSDVEMASIYGLSTRASQAGRRYR